MISHGDWSWSMTERLPWKFNPADLAKHRDQYCSLPRNLVNRGTWAALWKEGQASAISVLPVLGALGWDLNTRHVSRSKLATLAGLSLPTVDKGLAMLAERGLIEYQFLRGTSVVQFSVPEHVARTEADSHYCVSRNVFRFGAWCAFSGCWAMMQPTQRALYIALLASFRIAHLGMYGENCFYNSCDDVLGTASAEDRRLLEQLGLVQQYFSGGSFLERCIRLSQNSLSELTGVPRETVSRAVHDLKSLGKAAPFYAFRVFGEVMYHVPVRPSAYLKHKFLNGEDVWAHLPTAAKRRAYLRQVRGS